MKFILLLFSLSIAYSQPSLTLVTQTVRDASGQRVTGSCVYQAVSRFLAVDGSQIVGEPVTVNVVNGSFSALIVPTDTGVPGSQYYSVRCTGRRGWAISGNWIVPTSQSTLHWLDIWAGVPTPGILIPWTQMGQNGATTGQGPVWNGSSWAPGNRLGGGYSRSFDTQTTVTILGSEHQLGTGNLLIGCYDGSGMRVGSNTVSVDPTTYDVVVTFVVAQSGRCVVSGGGGASTTYVAPVNIPTYTVGTVSVTNGSDQVTGIGTTWTSDMDAGSDDNTTAWGIIIGPSQPWIRFTYVSSTQGQLARLFTGTTGTYTYTLLPSTFIPVSVHGLATQNIGVQCFSAGQPALTVQPLQVSRYLNFAVEIFWQGAVAGNCLLFR